MCFGGGAPKYKKPDFGPLPSLYVDPNTKSTVKPVRREEETGINYREEGGTMPTSGRSRTTEKGAVSRSISPRARGTQRSLISQIGSSIGTRLF